MRRWWPAVVLGALVVALGGWTPDRHGKSFGETPDADGRAQLMNADRAFAKAAGEKGLEGWVSFFADDAVRISPVGAKPAAGLPAIRKLDAALFADPKKLLVWEPTDAGLFADGNHGFTTGQAKVVARNEADKDKGPWTVRYVTWWRKDSDGRWRVILDTGASVPPKP
jgi:ketosteroid isomerase-like protein